MALAQRADFGTVLDILREAFERFYPDRPEDPFPRDVVLAGIESSETYLAIGDTIPVGTISLTDTGGPTCSNSAAAAHVHRLAVRPTAAGHGLGVFMLRWAEEQAKSGGKSCLRLDCLASQEPLKEYYQAAGFQFRGIHEFPNVRWEPVALFERAVGA